MDDLRGTLGQRILLGVTTRTRHSQRGRMRMDETLPMGEGIDRGRDCFDRQAWRGAYEHLTAAARDEPLGVDDLERLASAAYLAGRSAESSDAWASAHDGCAQIGEVARAARCAFWLAFALLNSGELARGGGWVDRAQRLLDDRKLDCVEQGYLRYAAAPRAVFSGDVATAHNGFRESVGIGERFRDPELITLSRIGEGRCLIYLGEGAKGVALLDEAMVAVGASEVSPIAMGDAYCTVIEGCHELFDVRRAREWTAALSRWREAQPELVLYRGECLVHRAEYRQIGVYSSDSSLCQVVLSADVEARPIGPLRGGCRSVLLGPGVTQPKSRPSGMSSRTRWFCSRSHLSSRARYPRRSASTRS